MDRHQAGNAGHRPSSWTVERAEENAGAVDLSEEEMKEIDSILVSKYLGIGMMQHG